MYTYNYFTVVHLLLYHLAYTKITDLCYVIFISSCIIVHPPKCSQVLLYIMLVNAGTVCFLVSHFDRLN